MGSCCIEQGVHPGALGKLRGVDGWSGGRKVQGGGDKCLPMTDSC